MRNQSHSFSLMGMRTLCRSFSSIVYSILWAIYPLSSFAVDLYQEERFTYDEGAKVAYVTASQLWPTFVSQKEIYSKLFKIDFDKGEQSIVSGFWDKPSSVITKPELSSNGKNLATLISEGPRDKKLVIISTEGFSAESIDNRVVFFDWSPDSNNIVYIKEQAEHNPELTGRSFLPEGVFVYSLVTKEKRKIAGGAYSIVWADFDNRIYLADEAYSPDVVVRIDPETGEQINTKFKGIQFSKTGKYYCQISASVPKHPKVIESLTGQLVIGFEDFVDMYGLTRNCKWLSDSLLSLSGGSSHFVYSLDKMEILRDSRDIHKDKKFIRNDYYPIAYSRGQQFVVYKQKQNAWELQDIVTGEVFVKLENSLFRPIVEKKR